MKGKAVWYVVSVVVIVGAIAAFRLAPNGNQSGHIRIGAPLSLTGSAAVWGQKSKNGIELAVKHFKAEGITVDVVFEDCASEPKTAVSALNKLIAEQVHYVVGDVSSSNVLAMAPIAEQSKVVLISSGASNPKISQAGDFILRTWQSDALEAVQDAEYVAKTLKWKNVAVVNIQNAYGEGLADAFKKSFSNKIGFSDSFAQGQNDFKNLCTKLKSAQVDGIYLPGYPDEMGLFIKQLREQNIQLPILSTQGFDDPVVLKRAGKTAEGVIYSVPKPPSEKVAIVKKFKTDYKASFGEDPGVTADAAYDATVILVRAIKQVGDDSTKVKDALHKVDTEGASGHIKFNANGDLIRDFAFKKVVNGKFIFLD